MSERSSLSLVMINLAENLGILNFYCHICQQETQIIGDGGKKSGYVRKFQEKEEKLPWSRNTLMMRPDSQENGECNTEGIWDLIFCVADLPSNCSWPSSH